MSHSPRLLAVGLMRNSEKHGISVPITDQICGIIIENVFCEL